MEAMIRTISIWFLLAKLKLIFWVGSDKIPHIITDAVYKQTNLLFTPVIGMLRTYTVICFVFSNIMIPPHKAGYNCCFFHIKWHSI